jgi:hypothetical protein
LGSNARPTLSAPRNSVVRTEINVALRPKVRLAKPLGTCRAFPLEAQGLGAAIAGHLPVGFSRFG